MRYKIHIYFYINYESDAIFVIGDLNSRIGAMPDTSSDFDGIPSRKTLDKTVNQHSQEFCEFLIDAKMCILNGRFDPTGNCYTSVSGRGSVVVDYICVPHDVFPSCKSFTVIPSNSLVEKHNLQNLLGNRSKVPDHSFICTEFDTGVASVISDRETGTSDEQYSTCPKFKLNRIPDDFMESELSRLAILDIIQKIESARETQSNIDFIYEELCTTIWSEMNDKIPKYDTSRSTRRRYKCSKPYWNDGLSYLWSEMRKKERLFLKCHDRNRRCALRQEFRNAQSVFETQLRQTGRAYRRTMADDIETMSTSNPNDFWKKVQNLGPRRDKTIPMHFYDENGHIVTDENRVFEKWKLDFENLYNSSPSDEFDQPFYELSKTHKLLLENALLDPLYSSNADLNCNITLEEIAAVIMKAKKHSSCGIDQIPYDVLKYPPVIAVIQQLFQLIFDTSIIPSPWTQSIICPILKDPSSDRSVPMNYRGVSLLSCISKLYSAFINNRLSYYLETNDGIADEQNGFRPNRSCEDHIFSLNSILRNNTSVFATFIDLKKAFDFVDRDLLLYKLLLAEIDGKMYDSIKSIYISTTSCIRINGKLTDWFDCKTGVKQGDCLSPTIFSLFVNDLVREINALELGIDVNGEKIALLLYADDIVLLSDNETNMQTMLNTLHEWCKKWRVLINTEKSKSVHFRKGRRNRSDFVFRIGQNIIETVDKYKYLGVIFHEKMEFSYTADALAKGAGRALGGKISKIHSLKEFGFKTFEKLDYACVVLILDYGSSVWGYKPYVQIDNVQNRAMRFFLGVHRFTPNLAITGEMGWYRVC